MTQSIFTASQQNLGFQNLQGVDTANAVDAAQVLNDGATKHRLAAYINSELNAAPPQSQAAEIKVQLSEEKLKELEAKIFDKCKELVGVAKKTSLPLELIELYCEFYSGGGLSILKYGKKKAFIDHCIKQASAKVRTLYHYFDVGVYSVDKGIVITEKNLPSIKALCMTYEEDRDSILEEAKRREKDGNFPTPKTINEVIKEVKEQKIGAVGAKVAIIKSTKSQAIINEAIDALKVLCSLAVSDPHDFMKLSAKAKKESLEELQKLKASDDFKAMG